MKKSLFLALFVLLSSVSFAQTILDIKTKTSANKANRNMMLDILRATMYKDYKQEFVFVVKHFKVSNNYAWLKADAQRKDGKKLELPANEPNDCCHVECLFKKSNGKWLIAESAAFSTDVWWADLEERYPEAAKGIFE